MKEMTIISNVLLVVSMVAAFAVVSVATLKILRSSYSRATAAVLALGVTVMALVGTGPVIFGPSQEDSGTGVLFPSGGALMLLPFLALAIGRLLCDLLVAANSTLSDPRPPAKGTEGASVADKPSSTSKDNEKSVSKGRPKGRPKKQAVKEGPSEHSVKPADVKQPLGQGVTTEAK